jgi:hypothetical protein
MKRIEQALNRKILEARFKVDRARRQIGCAFAGWALARAEAELEMLLGYAEEE